MKSRGIRRVLLSRIGYSHAVKMYFQNSATLVLGVLLRDSGVQIDSTKTRFLSMCYSRLIYHISLSDRNSSRRGSSNPEPASGGVSRIFYFHSPFPEHLSNPDARMQSSRLSFFGLSFTSRSHFPHNQVTDNVPIPSPQTLPSRYREAGLLTVAVPKITRLVTYQISVYILSYIFLDVF